MLLLLLMIFVSLRQLSGLAPAPFYKGDVLVVTGSNDTIVCATATGGGDCSGGNDSPPARSFGFFPAARSFEWYIPGRTGHGVDLHYSFPDTWAVIEGWLGSVGL